MYEITQRLQVPIFLPNDMYSFLSVSLIPHLVLYVPLSVYDSLSKSWSFALTLRSHGFGKQLELERALIKHALESEGVAKSRKVRLTRILGTKAKALGGRQDAEEEGMGGRKEEGEVQHSLPCSACLDFFLASFSRACACSASFYI